MQIQYSLHARQRMSEREITEEEIVLTISFPEKRLQQDDIHIAMRIRENKHLLIVIYTMQTDITKIITVIDTSKVEKYLERYA